MQSGTRVGSPSQSSPSLSESITWRPCRSIASVEKASCLLNSALTIVLLISFGAVRQRLSHDEMSHKVGRQVHDGYEQLHSDIVFLLHGAVLDDTPKEKMDITVPDDGEDMALVPIFLHVVRRWRTGRCSQLSRFEPVIELGLHLAQETLAHPTKKSVSLKGSLGVVFNERQHVPGRSANLR